MKSSGFYGARSGFQDLKDARVFLANQDAAQRFCPPNPKQVPRGRHLRFNHTSGRDRPNWTVRDGGTAAGAQALRWDIKATVGPDEKRLFAAQRAYLYTRPRLLRQLVPTTKAPLKTNPEPGCRPGPVYCIVESLNPRLRLLRTKQRLLTSAGMLAAVAGPLASPPPAHLSEIPPRKHSQPPGSSRGLLSDALVVASAFGEHYFPLPYLG